MPAEEDDMTGLSRRELIRRAAVVGALAWTAPVVIESLTSPAGALTGVPGCWIIDYAPGTTANSCKTAGSDPNCTPSGTVCANQHDGAGRRPAVRHGHDREL